MRGWVRRDALRRERIAVLEGVDGHVLGAVIREDALDVRQLRDRAEVSEKERHAQRALADIQ